MKVPETELMKLSRKSLMKVCQCANRNIKKPYLKIFPSICGSENSQPIKSGGKARSMMHRTKSSASPAFCSPS